MIVFEFISVLLLIELASAQDVLWETTCVTDPNGFPTIHMENHADQPMIFTIFCSSQTFSAYVPPHTTESLQAYFNYQPDADLDTDCILITNARFSHRAFIYAWNMEEDFLSIAFNDTYCSEEPGLDLRLEEWDDIGKEYDFYYYYYGYDMEPHSRLTMTAEFYKGENEYYRRGLENGSCVFFPQTDSYNFIFYDSMDGYVFDFYTSGVLWCTGRHALDVPIVKLFPHCPPLVTGRPSLELRADVPAYGLARCLNGDQAFTSINEVSAVLAGSFSQLDESSCVFFWMVGVEGGFFHPLGWYPELKKTGVDTYTVDVEVGWGEEDREVFLYQKIHTVSCSYDMHGSAVSTVEFVSDWFVAPNELQTLVGLETTGTFKLRVLDVLNQQIDAGQISIGRKIRLKAEDVTGTLPAFRALSCIATNGVSSYPILRAGCGDGVILDKDEGFVTDGAVVYSPFFNAFKLRGGQTLWFHCRFTVCGFGGCNGSSCASDAGLPDTRAKRSSPESPGIYEGFSMSYNLG